VGLLLACFQGASVPAANEPTNDQEAAARKAAEEKAVDEKFQAWKATLPPEQQAWEKTLEECLGGFCLPLYKKDKVVGRMTAWDYVKEDPELPRVLLLRNEVAARVMKERGISVNDLCTFIQPHLVECQNPKDCHFSGKGYDLLGGRVAEEILKALGK
jgi:hypothetical protein